MNVLLTTTNASDCTFISWQHLLFCSTRCVQRRLPLYHVVLKSHIQPTGLTMSLYFYNYFKRFYVLMCPSFLPSQVKSLSWVHRSVFLVLQLIENKSC